MLTYLFRSAYRFAILGLIVALIGLWYFWVRTEVSSSLNLYTTAIVLLNTALAGFTYDRQTFITKSLFFFSYLVVILAAYTLVALILSI